MPTAKGQALADEYGIKFFETVSSNPLLIVEAHIIESVLVYIERYCLL